MNSNNNKKSINYVYHPKWKQIDITINIELFVEIYLLAPIRKSSIINISQLFETVHSLCEPSFRMDVMAIEIYGYNVRVRVTEIEIKNHLF